MNISIGIYGGGGGERPIKIMLTLYLRNGYSTLLRNIKELVDGPY